jgi:hypothetical protein
MRNLPLLLGLLALSGCVYEVPVTGGHTASPTNSYPTEPDQPVYTGAQDYRPGSSYVDPEKPFSTPIRMPGLQPLQPPLGSDR